MSAVIAALEAFLERFMGPLHDGPPSRDREPVVLAASGGPDSSALLVAACRLKDRRHVPVRWIVVNVNHGLRAQAVEDAAAVGALCARFGADEVSSLHGDARQEARSHRTSLQDGARRLRYRLLAAEAQRVGARYVLTGHTRDDQSETVLLQLLRGAGLHGVGAMRPVRALHGSVLLGRPLLTVTRLDVAALLAQHDVLPQVDPSNLDRRFRRARVRQELLPALRLHAPQVDERLVALARQARELTDWLDGNADAWLHHHGGAEPGRELLDGARLRTEPRALQVAVLRRWFAVHRGLQGIRRAHLEAAARELGRSHGSRSVQLPGGWWVRRRYDLLRLEQDPAKPAPPGAASSPAAVLMDGPGAWHLPGCGYLEISRLSVPDAAARPAGLDRTVVPAGLRLLLRPRLPGDRIQLRAGRRKLKELFIDAKVPRDRRDRWPVVLAVVNEREPPVVLWVPGLARAALMPIVGAAEALELRFRPEVDELFL